MNSIQSIAPNTGADWLTRNQLLVRLGIDRSTLYRWETHKIGPPFVRLGGRKFYPAAALDAWLAARQFPNAGAAR